MRETSDKKALIKVLTSSILLFLLCSHAVAFAEEELNSKGKKAADSLNKAGKPIHKTAKNAGKSIEKSVKRLGGQIKNAINKK